MLPKNVSEGEVSALFSQYGSLKDLQILRGSQQTSKGLIFQNYPFNNNNLRVVDVDSFFMVLFTMVTGCAFVKYETKEQAVAAIEDLNGKHKMEVVCIQLIK